MSSDDLGRVIGEAEPPRLVSHNDGLQVLKIGKRYKKRPVLREVSMQLKRGEIVGLLGPNGAGKTTLMNILFGHYVADSGEIVVRGKILPKGSPKASLMQDWAWSTSISHLQKISVY